MVNIGNNPTFDGTGTSIETFLFDFEGDLYGRELTVEFVEYIRGEIVCSTRSISSSRSQPTARQPEILSKRKTP